MITISRRDRYQVLSSDLFIVLLYLFDQLQWVQVGEDVLSERTALRLLRHADRTVSPFRQVVEQAERAVDVTAFRDSNCLRRCLRAETALWRFAFDAFHMEIQNFR